MAMMNPNTKHAFTLLISILVGGIMLSIGFSLVSLSVKQVQLSSAGRESQFGFYAADSGIECALFWDNPARNTNGTSLFASTSLAETNIKCGAYLPSPALPPFLNRSVNPMTASLTDDILTTTFEFRQRLTEPSSCTKVIVVKNDGTNQTTITSEGYNTCDPNSITRLQRAIKIEY